MATLYVENVPDELYEALRSRARRNRSSISAEVLKLLAESVPTADELARRKQFAQAARKLRSRSRTAERFPPVEEMLREDRSR
jgi:plasmid stability protein